MIFVELLAVLAVPEFVVVVPTVHPFVGLILRRKGKG
jgi:hypothetical protein